MKPITAVEQEQSDNSLSRKSGRLAETFAYQLSTEAQWEYACRAGTKTAFAFGDTLAAEDANFDPLPQRGRPGLENLRETSPGGNFRANDWNFYNMHGNLWEWCRDGYAEALRGGDDPYIAPTQNHEWVYRGGCWHNPPEMCRSAGSRAKGIPDQRGSGLGFRVARVATGF